MPGFKREYSFFFYRSKIHTTQKRKDLAKNKIVPKCGALIIGGSAGSLDVILSFLTELRVDISFPVIIVLHRRNSGDSMLSDLFSYKTKLPVKEVEDKDIINPGHIYIAPPGYHLLIENENLFSLDSSERVNYSRPSIDLTFESAANVFQKSLVCILLSGANADGVQGLKMVKKKGGYTVVQDPLSAKVPYMPAQAIAGLKIDRILTPDQMAEFINAL